MPPIAKVEHADAAYAKTLGITGDDAAALAALRALPAQTLVSFASGLPTPGALDDAARPQPMIDGTLIVERVDDAFRRGHQARIPYMIGGNSWEASVGAPGIAANPDAVLSLAGSDRAKTLALFGDGLDPVTGAYDPVKAAYNYVTDSSATEADRYVAREDAKVGVPSYLYYFSYVPTTYRDKVPGAAHASEILYVFDNTSPVPVHLGSTSLVLPAATPEDFAMSRAMHAYWVAFAKTGKPDSAGGPPWAPYNTEADNLLEFGADGVKVRNHFKQDRMDLLGPKAEEAAAKR
jgi:para-nitrobenzyl esterase